MHLPPWLHTIKLRIVAITLATAVLSALGTAALMLRTTETDLLRLLEANERADRERVAALMSGKVETVVQALLAVARHTPLGHWADQEAMEQHVLGNAALGSLFDSVLAARPDGTLLVRTERGAKSTELPNIADRDYFVQAMQTDQPVVSRPLRGKVSKLPLVVVAVPVLDEQGRHLGVIGGTLRLQSNSLFALGGHRAASDATVDIVFDREGTILSHPRAARLLGRADEEPGLREVYRRWKALGSPIDLDGSAGLADGHFVSMAGIPLSDWMHARVTPQAQALQPVAQARRAVGASALGAGLIAALVTSVLAWRLVRPLGRLRDCAHALIEGREAGPWPGGSDEIAAVSRAFESLMAQRNHQQAQQHDVLVELEAVLENAEVGIALSRDGNFEMVSSRFCDVVRAGRRQLVGRPTSIIHADATAYEAFSARAHPSFMACGHFEGETELRRLDGEIFWARMRGRAVVPGDRSRGTIWVVEDVTEARRQREALSWAASHDALTGLMNRAAFERLLEEAHDAAASAPFCALFVDLDRFKLVNDTAGHAAGDALLKGIAQALLGAVRHADVVARLGGDEFAVLLPGCPMPHAQELAERLRTAVLDYRLAWEGQAFAVGASVGLVLGDGRHGSAAELLREADAACYEAKRGGRNRVVSRGGPGEPRCDARHDARHEARAEPQAVPG